MLSYAYYIANESLIPDTEYDALAKRLLGEWDTFTHPHKHLVTKGDLEAGTLFRLGANHYPLMVRCAAERWIDAVKRGRDYDQEVREATAQLCDAQG